MKTTFLAFTRVPVSTGAFAQTMKLRTLAVAMAVGISTSAFGQNILL